MKTYIEVIKDLREDHDLTQSRLPIISAQHSRFIQDMKKAKMRFPSDI